jgi:DNA-binding NarL/FixJ family response regulator
VAQHEETAPIRVLVVEDHAALAETLRMAIDLEPGLECVGLAPTVTRALELAVELAPEVVLMDVRLPDGGGVEATARLKGLRPETSVIVLTAMADPEYLLQAAEAGASGFLRKESRISEILRAVRRVRAGEPALPPEALRALVVEASREGPPSVAPAPHLTAPERAVLDLLGEGLGPEAIADRLEITLPAARDRVGRVAARLGARSELEAIVIAARARLLPGAAGEESPESP